MRQAILKDFHQKFERESKLSNLYKDLPPLASDRTAMEDILGSGYKEFTHSKSTSNQSLIMNSERAYRSMNTTASNEIDRLDSSLSVLAMIASSSPYIGLFGTVWGIMHSFIGLASVKQATIAVVAPGIAEALIATAFGLFAAIPATIAYNRLVSQVEEIGNKYTAFVEGIVCYVTKTAMIALPKRARPDTNADINIVPYIDVMLVLLVIFMMTTPIIEQGIEVDLPQAPATMVEYEDQQPTVIGN